MSAPHLYATGAVHPFVPRCKFRVVPKVNGVFLEMNTDRFVRERERRELTGVPTSTWYEMMGVGQAPRPVKIGPRAVAWVDSELAEWRATRIAERDGQVA